MFPNALTDQNPAILKSRLLRPAGTQQHRRWLYVIEWTHAHNEAAPAASADCLEALVINEMAGETANVFVPGHVSQSDTGPDAAFRPGRWLAVLFMMCLRCTKAELPVVGAALSLLQSQAKLETPPVWICTRDTQSVSSLTVGGFSHAGLWGLTRSCRQESATHVPTPPQLRVQSLLPVQAHQQFGSSKLMHLDEAQALVTEAVRSMSNVTAAFDADMELSEIGIN